MSSAAKMAKNLYAERAAGIEAMDEPCHERLPQTRWFLEDAVKVLHQNRLKPKFGALSKLHGGIDFQVYSSHDSGGGAIVFKYPGERWVYNDNDWGIDRFQLLRQECNLLKFAGEHGIPVPEVIAYFDPRDGPQVLVLEHINVDGTLPSDAEIGETVRRLHRLSPPALIDWSNALIAVPILELGRVAEYGGLSPEFATGYQLTSDMTAALDRERGISLPTVYRGNALRTIFGTISTSRSG